jgi:hypothetical protein
MEGGFGRPGQEETARDLAGLQGIYRLGFKAMLVDGLPEQFTFGGAVIRHTMDPVTTNRTLIVQQPGLGVEWVNTREEGVEIGAGVPKCVVHVPFEVSENVVIDFSAMRQHALGLIGALAALLDERIAQEELFQDALLLDPQTDEDVATIDASLQVREFRPRVFSEKEEQAVNNHQLSADIPPVTTVAARWYLKGAQTGPTLDSIVFFWVAIEALIPHGGKKTEKQVEEALTNAGTDPSTLPVSVGRLYGLRADIVHKGLEDPPLLREGHYVLETIVRTLIRNSMKASTTWPPEAGLNNWPEPVKSLIEGLRGRSRTHWQSASKPENERGQG